MDIIIKDRNVLIGIVSVDTRYPFSWELESLQVEHKYRGMGFGTTLIKAAIAYADANGKDLELIVASGGSMTNAQLTAWYASHGFQHTSIGMRRNYVKKENKVVDQEGIPGEVSC